MKLAFLISTHTDPTHLARLVNALPKEADYYIHVDARTDITPFRQQLDMENVHFATHRYKIMWGSIGQVRYQMELIAMALESKSQYDYLISMSGLDYPVWSNEAIEAFFTKANGKEILAGVAVDEQGEDADLYRQYRFLNSQPWRYGSLGSKCRVALRHLIWALGFRKPLTMHTRQGDYRLFKGSSWWAITPDLAAAALRQWQTNKVYVRYFASQHGPDETFIPTLAFNSPEFAPRCIRHEGRIHNLSEVTPLTFIDYGESIKVMTLDDYDRVIGSGKMFCRKTVTGESDAFMDKIDKQRK